MSRTAWFFILATLHHPALLVGGRMISRPADEFASYKLVTPRLYHPTERKELFSTLEEGGRHARHITLTCDIHGQEHTLDLFLNTDLLSESYFEKYQYGDGYTMKEPKDLEAELCHYKGHIRGIPGSSAAISTCYGISGAIFDGEEVHYLESGHSQEEERKLWSGSGEPHFLYSRSDRRDNSTCGTSDKYGDTTLGEASENGHRVKRNVESEVHVPYNADSKSRYVELVLVVDKKASDVLQDNVFQYCRKIVNHANMITSPLNIFIALVGVVVWREQNEVEVTTNGRVTIRNFLKYRHKVLLEQHPNDNAFLLTGENLDKMYGIGHVSGMCSPVNSGGVLKYRTMVGDAGNVLAHELGHNLGMHHDEDHCRCGEKYCIMGNDAFTASVLWSDCSRKYLADFLGKGVDGCIRNEPKRLFGRPVCGNGFLEEGEECDCGVAVCDNPCCESFTCRLRPGAKCATGKCCDLQTCDLRPKGTHCRAIRSECDLEDSCSGESEFCPDVFHKADGEQCHNGQDFCYDGTCRTRDHQCSLLWGQDAVSAPTYVYGVNLEGSRFGHCGVDGETFKACDYGDMTCGMMHCMRGKKRLSVDDLTDHRSPEDLLVPNGAKCGDGHMCVNQRCVSVEEVRNCPSNCSGRGICDNLSLCHCDPGFDPPECRTASDGSIPNVADLLGGGFDTLDISHTFTIVASISGGRDPGNLNATGCDFVDGGDKTESNRLNSRAGSAVLEFITPEYNTSTTAGRRLISQPARIDPASVADYIRQTNPQARNCSAAVHAVVRHCQKIVGFADEAEDSDWCRTYVCSNSRQPQELECRSQ